MILFDRPGVVAVSLVVLLAMVVVGLWAARRTRDTRDFFIAGQRIGLVVTGFATMSASFSGFVFLGGAGSAYRLGLGSIWIVLPVGFTGGLLCWVVGRRLCLLSRAREVYTIPEAIACRFGSRAAGGLAAVAVVLGTVAYLGSQLLALGVLLQAVLGLERFVWAMLLGLVVLVVYSVVGGMVAGVYTDVLQGGLMLVAAVAVFFHAIATAGGWRELTTSIVSDSRFGPEFLEPLGTLPLFTAFGFFFVFGVGVLGQPHLLHKFYMLDDPRKLRWMPMVLGAGQSLCLLVWLGIGLAVPALVAQGRLGPLGRPDDAAPAYLLHFAPEFLAGLVLAAVVAAIMSTADSFVNIGSAALVRDLPRLVGRAPLPGLFAARLAVVVISLAAAWLAWAWSDLIYLLGTFAFGTFGAALGPALAVGLNWRRVSAAAATASIATGLVLSVGLEFLARQAWWPWLPRPNLAHGVLPSAVALAASFCVLFLVSWFGGRQRDEELPEDVQAVLDG